MSRSTQHGLAIANAAHSLSRVGQSGKQLPTRKMSLQVSIIDSRLAPRRQPIRYTQDDVTSPLAGIKNARPVAEPAGFATSLPYLIISQIEREHRLDRFGCFLSIGADVLHRRPTHASRDATQAFHPRAVSCYSASGKLVPFFSGADVENRFAIFISLIDSRNPNFQDKAWPARIGDDQIASTAQYKKRQISRACERNRFLHLGNGLVLDEIPRRAANLHRRQRRQRHVFLHVHESWSNYI